MTPLAEKVTALIVRDVPAGREVLLFRHPHAGVQVPAGTVEEGEAPVDAALREAQEETGLPDLAIVRSLGVREVTTPEDRALIGRACTVYSRPDPSSWDWVHLRRGLLVYVLRREDDWVQIDFRENNRFPDPEYLTFQVIGWVRAEILATTVRRHFYLLTPTVPVLAGEWSVNIDYHIFRPFWARLDEVLENRDDIVEPQREWLDYLQDTLDAPPVQPGSIHPFP